MVGILYGSVKMWTQWHKTIALFQFHEVWIWTHQKGYVNVPHRFQEQVKRTVYIFQTSPSKPTQTFGPSECQKNRRDSIWCTQKVTVLILSIISLVFVSLVKSLFSFIIIHSFNKLYNYYLAGYRICDGNVMVNPTVLVPVFLEVIVIRGQTLKK